MKVQGGKRTEHIIRAVAGAGIPCLSHIGLVPHIIAMLGGFKVQGRTSDDAKRIYDDAFAIQEAGAIGIEIEAVPPVVAEQITKDLDIITYGIGAGLGCDGQILIAWDMLGYFDAFKPKFVKRYATMAQIAVDAISSYASEVRKEEFPQAEHTYSMNENEIDKFKKMLQRV